MDDKYYMSIAIKLAKKAFRKSEVPVGAVIVCDNKILSTAYNKKNITGRTINHAEIIAIDKANKKKHDWRLNGCTMYVSLKPCDMCMGAIREARISRVVYASDRCCDSSNVTYEQVSDMSLIDDSSKLIKKFFEIRR